MSNQQNDVFCLNLNSKYSTTRMVSKERPEIINKSGAKVQTLLFLPSHPERQGEGGLRAKGYFKRSLPGKPLVSIITIVFNSQEHIEKTIRSVIEQAYENVEYIIIDGGSTDGSLNTIKKYEDAIDYWISEPDEGISDAFNKGVSLSLGQVIGIINADDWYEENTLNSIVGQLDDGDILHGLVQYWNNNSRERIYSPTLRRMTKEMTINHPTVFVKKDIYEKYGLFKKEYRYAMDYELLLRFYIQQVKFTLVNKVLANMRYAGASDRNWTKAAKEVMVAKIENTNSYIMPFLYLCKQVIRGKARRLLEHIGSKLVVNLYKKNCSIMRKW